MITMHLPLIHFCASCYQVKEQLTWDGADNFACLLFKPKNSFGFN